MFSKGKNLQKQPYDTVTLLFFICIAAICLLRLVLLPIHGFKIDIAFWQAWATRIVATGPPTFFTSNLIANYLPFYYYIIWLQGALFQVLTHRSFYDPLFETYFKFWTNLFDFGTAYLIYQIVKKSSSGWAKIAALFYLLNPGVLFNSTVWGQVDAVPIFFSVLSVYWLITEKHMTRGFIAAALSFLIKPFNAALYPMIGIYSLKKYPFKSVVVSILLTVLVAWLLIVPYFLSDPLFGIFKHLTDANAIYPYTSMNGFSFWSIVGMWLPDSTRWLGITYYQWGIILYATVLIVLLFPFIRRKQVMQSSTITLSFALSSFGFFLFLTRIAERHIFPTFAFLIIAACLYRSWFLISSYVVLAVVHFLNLWYSYFYYTFVYNNPTPKHNLLYDFAVNHHVSLAVINLIVFGMILIYYYRYLRYEQT